MTDSTYIRNYGSKRVYLNNYLYAPRMYDKNNTGYYVDPASTSKLNDLYIYDDLFVGSSAGDDGADMYIADKLYDWDNTGYYINPASTSRLYRIDGNYFYYASDISLKKNIKPISNALDKVLQLQGVRFNWKDTNKPSIGLISQDVEKIFPEIVSTDEQGLKSIEYAKLVAPLIEALKEQQKEIEELKAEIEELKLKIK